MSRRRAADEKAARQVRSVARRAARRLEILEWVILGGAVLAATGGGALVAAVLSVTLGISFRTLWVVASVLLFAVPGGLALRRARREGSDPRPLTPNEKRDSDV